MTTLDAQLARLEQCRHPLIAARPIIFDPEYGWRRRFFDELTDAQVDAIFDLHLELNRRLGRSAD